MLEYIKNEYGLPIRQWPDKTHARTVRRAGWLRENLVEGRIRFDRQPGEVDRGSRAYLVQKLIDCIHKLSNAPRPFEEDGWY